MRWRNEQINESIALIVDYFITELLKYRLFLQIREQLIYFIRASLVAQQWRIHLSMQELLVWSLGQQGSPEKEIATHSSGFQHTISEMPMD